MASALTFALAKAQGPQRSLRMVHCGLVPSLSHTQLEPEPLPTQACTYARDPGNSFLRGVRLEGGRET